MAQKEGIRHKKPLEYSAALGFLLIQPLSLWRLPRSWENCCSSRAMPASSEMMIWRFGRRDATRLWVGRVKMKACPENEAMLR